MRSYYKSLIIRLSSITSLLYIGFFVRDTPLIINSNFSRSLFPSPSIPPIIPFIVLLSKALITLS